MNDIETQRARRAGELIECVLPFDVTEQEDTEGMFVLGVEWEMVHSALRSGLPFSRPIHARNAERLAKLAERLGVPATIEPHAGYEGCETWMEMTVTP